ncbi:MAG: hypothetical protein ABXS93_07160 [Sulfurimonas sp.]
MKIATSNIAMDANYEQKHFIREQEHLKQWVDNSADKKDVLHAPKGDQLSLSNEYDGFDPMENLDPYLQKIVRALEILTGKKIKIGVFHPKDHGSAEQVREPQAQETPQRVGWGIDYSYQKTEVKQQSLQFASSGKVSLEDGREIDFKLAFSMQSKELKHETLSFKAGDALIDPLVIQFQDGEIALTDVKTNLDLNLDGKKEEFSFTRSGSGFLMLDKNGDGIVNDGSELFGPNSGDGFDDLRIYDRDNNNWIDENDAVFEQLKIWTKDQNGDERYYSLKEAGVGALYLQSVTTPFEMKDGNLAQSSVFLRENGSSGIISEVDLKV